MDRVASGAFYGKKSLNSMVNKNIYGNSMVKKWMFMIYIYMNVTYLYGIYGRYITNDRIHDVNGGY